MALTLIDLGEAKAKFSNTGASTLAAPSADLVQALLGFPSSAGKPVTRATAIRVAAVLASVKMLANDIAKMPLILRETNVVNGRQRTQPALNNPLYSILKDVPNRWQTSYQMRWFLASQLIMNGNCFCQKITNQKGDIIELVPMNAWAMSVKWDYSDPKAQVASDGTKTPVLKFRYECGNGRFREFYQDEIWHVSAHNLEGIGIEGAAMIALAKEAISVLIAAEETAGRNFANGLGMGGFISFPESSGITEEQSQNIVDRLKKDFAGSQNAGKFSIIPYGGTWQKMTFNAQESQLIESRKWNEETVARLFGGAPLVVKLGLGQQNSTYASSSAFLDEYFNTTLLPYTTAIEQTITRDLIAPSDRSRLYAKHSADIILRGSPEDRAKTNQIKIQSFQMTPNEARQLEDMDTIEGGDFLSGGTGTPVIFDIAKQEFFIPGQLVPEPQGTGTPNDSPNDSPDPEPDAQGTGEDKDEALKTKARLRTIANSLADRILRKSAKTEIDPKFVAEVLNCTPDAANKYCEKYKTLSLDEQRAALVQITEEA